MVLLPYSLALKQESFPHLLLPSTHPSILLSQALPVPSPLFLITKAMPLSRLSFFCPQFCQTDSYLPGKLPHHPLSSRKHFQTTQPVSHLFSYIPAYWGTHPSPNTWDTNDCDSSVFADHELCSRQHSRTPQG